MTPARMTPASITFEDERSRLFGLAYRMLGSVADAEDVVQDAYLRWAGTDQTVVREPAAWLTTVTTRLALDPVIPNIQASWVKMGPDGAALLLDAGCNDLGGVLMNESITRAAGATHGQEVSAAELEALIRGRGRTPRQRSTLYGPVTPERRQAAE